MAQHLHQRTLRQIVVDVGNTSTAVGLWSGGRVTMVSHSDGGFGESTKKVDGILKACPGRIESIAYVSVVPKEDRKWRSFARIRGVELRQVTLENARWAGLELDYPEPMTIGADRLADAVGAMHRYGAPTLVMDFGTAMTAAVITADGVWRGGVIAPGFPLMRDYLFERTAKLPRMEIGRGNVPKIGRSTEEAMRFGAIVGYRGMVREIVSELQKNFKEEFKLVATGGFARWALKDMGLPFVVDSTLTLYGTGVICSRGHCC